MLSQSHLKVPRKVGFKQLIANHIPNPWIARELGIYNLLEYRAERSARSVATRIVQLASDDAFSDDQARKISLDRAEHKTHLVYD